MLATRNYAQTLDMKKGTKTGGKMSLTTQRTGLVAALARPVVELHPALLAGAVAVFASERFGLAPVLLLAIAIGVGAAAGAAGY